MESGLLFVWFGLVVFIFTFGLFSSFIFFFHFFFFKEHEVVRLGRLCEDLEEEKWYENILYEKLQKY